MHIGTLMPIYYEVKNPSGRLTVWSKTLYAYKRLYALLEKVLTNEVNVREKAARFYEKALKPVAGSACCGASKATPIVIAAGYESGDLQDVPADAAGNSFGCGNPFAFAAVLPEQTVLDLGAGAGLDLIIAAQKVGPKGRVIGVDLSEVMLARAQANVEQAGLRNVDLRQGAIEDLPVESNSVDWVVSNCVINLSPDKLRVFREIRRVLKPGAKMLVSDIVADGLPDWLKSNSDLHSACVTGALTELDYLGAIREAGLADVAVVDRLRYDDSSLRVLITDALPVSLDDLACSMGKSADDVVAAVVSALSGRVQSLRIAARRAD
jgi:SAM-dependent methyltransferase